MPYNYPTPLKRGEYFVSYPHHYLKFKDNEKKFKRYIFSYLKTNEPTSIPLGITEDLRLVCRMNPENTIEMVNDRRAELKQSKSKSKKGRKK